MKCSNIAYLNGNENCNEWMQKNYAPTAMHTYDLKLRTVVYAVQAYVCSALYHRVYIHGIVLNWYAVIWLLAATCCGSNWPPYILQSQDSFKRSTSMSLEFCFNFIILYYSTLDAKFLFMQAVVNIGLFVAVVGVVGIVDFVFSRHFSFNSNSNHSQCKFEKSHW